jgi:putative DNA primase/helicase
MEAATFSESMATHGLHCSDIVPDGKIHRFNVNGDKPGSHNGWYVSFGDAGACGSWKTGETFTWCAKNEKSLSDVERAKLKKQIDEAKKARDEEQRRLHAKAREKAVWICDHSKPVEKHPYLAAKGLNLSSLRVDDQNRLVIPIRDTAGAIHSLQFINSKGEKKFLFGGAITGHFSTIDGTGDTLLICEGFSTGLSLHAATGYPVACALNCGNLKPVCKALHKKSPNVKLVVCSEDDYQTDGNPGLTKAREAAEAVGAALAVPKFKDQAHRGTDYNDGCPCKHT